VSAAELAVAIRRRFPKADPSLEADLAACEDAAWSDTISPRSALKLLQTLHGHQQRLSAAQKSGVLSTTTTSGNTHFKQQERAS
jgi:hypothetical protein